MSALGLCTAATCISTTAVGAIFAGLAGVWALGYGVGQSMKWTARIRDVA